MNFSRYLPLGDIELMKEMTLFKEYLLKDCQSGDVFPAIRSGRIDFYHKGGKLFSWSKGAGFSTHRKYASVLWPANDKNPYVQQEALSDGTLRLITDFIEGYSRIKENCALYSGEEAAGVAQLYHGFSCASHKNHDVVVLDIEVAFTKDDEEEDGKDKSRIDIVTFEYATKKLRFFEAKHYSNRGSLRSLDKEKGPYLKDQLEKYDKHLLKKEEILQAYSSHVTAINDIFDTNISAPQDIDTMTKAIIFGFDNEQKAYLNKNIIPQKSDLRNRTYAVGDLKNADLQTLFRGGRQNWE